MNSKWSALLPTELACEGVLAHLSYKDVACWLVSALESDEPRFAHSLLTQTPYKLLDNASTLQCAAAHGCMHAVYTLRKNKKQRRPNYEDEIPFPDCIDAKYKLQVQRMRWITTFRMVRFPRQVMYEAARRGDLRVVQWVHTLTDYEAYVAVECAACGGHVEVVQWLADHQHELVNLRELHAEMLAPFEPSQDFVAWVVVTPRQKLRQCCATTKGMAPPTFTSTKSKDLYDAVAYAVDQGDLELLKSLMQTRSRYNWSFTGEKVVQAAELGQLEIIQWLVEQGVSDYKLKDVVKVAVESGHVKILDWLQSTKQIDDCPYALLRTASIYGHLEVLQWLRAHYPQVRCRAGLIDAAVAKRRWPVVQWLHEAQGLRLTPNMMADVAESGELELVQWLRERLPPDAEIPRKEAFLLAVAAASPCLSCS